MQGGDGGAERDVKDETEPLTVQPFTPLETVNAFIAYSTEEATEYCSGERYFSKCIKNTFCVCVWRGAGWGRVRERLVLWAWQVF